MKLKNLREALLFGKVLSAGLVIAGYAFLGVWLSNWLNSNGWPVLISLLAIPVITCFGMWQAWLFVKKWRNNDTITADNKLNRKEG
ncbi:MAG: hypothetical protein IJT58_03435 [Synergistaceae bacterium]|nr:hypothetical protein [Synergistaceae bacterium]